MKTLAHTLLNLAMRGLSALGGTALSIVIARLIGPEGVGQFAVFLSLLGVLSILARQGGESLLMRTVAWAIESPRTGLAVALFWYAQRRILVQSFLLGCLGAVILGSGLLGIAFPGAIAIMPLCLPLFSVLALVSGYARGMSRSWLAPCFGIGGISVLAACLVLLCSPLAGLNPAVNVALAFTGALLLLLILALVMVLHDSPRPESIPVLNDQEKQDFYSGQTDFVLIALSVFLTQAGCFILAAPFLSEVELGLLRAAERLALLVSFPLLAINPMIAPKLVRLSRREDFRALKKLMIRSTLGCLGMAACILLPILICPEAVLMVMGEEFKSATMHLRIMAGAQFLIVVLGPFSMQLQMSGRERVYMWINLKVLALAAVFFPIFCLMFGVFGFTAVYAGLAVVRSFLLLMACDLDLFTTSAAHECLTKKNR